MGRRRPGVLEQSELLRSLDDELRMSSEPPLRLLEFVTPEDPFGSTNAYMKCRIVAKAKSGLIPVFWTQHTSDSSMVFGFSEDMQIRAVGEAFEKEPGALAPLSETNVTTPEVLHSGLHATLHPSGLSRMSSRQQVTITKGRLDGWLPVREPFLWLVAVSNPLCLLKKCLASRKRDAIAPVGDAACSLLAVVHVVPPAPNGKYEVLSNALGTVIGMGPEFCLRVTLFRKPQVSGAMYIRVLGDPP